MKRKRHTPEEIIRKLREAATLPAGGCGLEAACKQLAVSPPTYQRWKEQYGGAKEETVKRLKALEKEDGKLKSWWQTCPRIKRCSRSRLGGTDRRETYYAAA